MKLLISMLTLLAVLPWLGFAEDEKTKKGLPSDENEVRVSRGLRYSVPKDWPMDERNGGISPVPTEEYMLFKFKKIDERLAALESQMKLKVDSNQPVELKKVSALAAGRLQSFEQKPVNLAGEEKENEKASS